MVILITYLLLARLSMGLGCTKTMVMHDEHDNVALLSALPYTYIVSTLESHQNSPACLRISISYPTGIRIVLFSGYERTVTLPLPLEFASLKSLRCCMALSARRAILRER